jgi:hypothetical protein
MVTKVQGSRRHDVEITQSEAPHLEKVNWMSDPGLRKLYFWAFIICIASATTGYDAYVIRRTHRGES